MDNQFDDITPQPMVPSGSNVVHGVMNFLRIARHRKHVIVGSMLVAAILGSLYYAGATPIYQSKAGLLILQMGEMDSASMNVDNHQQDIMPTHQSLIKKAVVLRGAFKLLKPEHRVDFREVPPDKWVEKLGQNLSVSVTRRTNIMEVCYRSRDPEAAAAVVRAVVQSYLDFVDKHHRGTASENIQILTREKDKLQQNLEAKQLELLAARRQYDDFGLDRDSESAHPLIQRITRSNNALIEARNKRVALEASLAALRAAMRNGDDLQGHIMTVQSTVGRELLLAGLGFSSQDVDVQTRLEQSLLEDRARLQTLSAGYGPNHPEIAEINERIRLTKQYLDTYHDKLTNRLSQMRATKLGPMLEGMLQQSLDQTRELEERQLAEYEQACKNAQHISGELANLEILEHDVERLRGMHDAMKDKIASMDLNQEQGDIRATVVEEPIPTKTPVSPNVLIVGVVCFMSSMTVGGVAVYVLDILDDRFRSPEELRLHLGVPVLAMVRNLEMEDEVGFGGVQAHLAPDAVASEAFRTLRTALAFSRHENGRLVVSSSEPGDGKTTVTVNLAVSLAQAGKKTLLIDADLRRPGLTGLLGFKGLAGLSDVLRSEGDVVESATTMIQRTEVDNLDVLPSGVRRPNPSELLSRPNLGDLLAWADSVYDQILIDSPPVLAASDAQLIGRLVDGVILIVNSEKNHRRAVVRAVESFSVLDIHVFGVVANRVTADAHGGYGYGYGYGYTYNYDDETDDDCDDPPTVKTPLYESDSPFASQARELYRPRDVA